MQNASFSPLSTTLAIGAHMNLQLLEQLVIREMPYGKYKGRLIADLPGQYLNWFARQGFPSGELGGLLALMHEVDHNGLSDLLIPLRARPVVDRPE